MQAERSLTFDGNHPITRKPTRSNGINTAGDVYSGRCKSPGQLCRVRGGLIRLVFEIMQANLRPRVGLTAPPT
jgi:hypothetical protein